MAHTTRRQWKLCTRWRCTRYRAYERPLFIEHLCECGALTDLALATWRARVCACRANTELRRGGSDQCAHQVLQKTNIIQITLRFYAKILTGILSVTCGAEQPRITHTLTRTLAELLERRADLVFFALVVFIE